MELRARRLAVSAERNIQPVESVTRGDDPLYAWVEDWCASGMSVTMIEHRTAESVLKTAAPVPATALMASWRLRDWFQFEDRDGGRKSILEVGTVNDWTVLVATGSLPTEAALLQLSVGTRVVGVTRTVNADMTFRWIVDGFVVRRFDPVLYGTAAGTSVAIGTPLPEEEGLPFDPRNVLQSTFVLVERMTRVRLTRDLVDSPMSMIGIGLVSVGD